MPGVNNADLTDCHIDALAKFVKSGLVVLSQPTGHRGRTVWTRVYEGTKEVLSNATDAQGREIEI